MLPRTLVTAHPSLATPPSPPQDELKDEVRDMAKKLGAAGMQLLVIDTGGGGEGPAGAAPGRCWTCLCARPALMPMTLH